jgi:type IV pilus assembly protein PilE
MKQSLNSRIPAFTLTELMVVLVIIGILIMIALPVFDGLFSQAYAVEAQNQLKFLQARQQSYYQKYFQYSANLQDVGFTAPALISDGGDARYTYEVVQAGKAGFAARATAVADFDSDGSINVWEINEKGLLKEVTPD